jgi:hypothetical protein
MKRVLLAVALAAGALSAAESLGRQAVPASPVTIHVAVERPLPMPAATGNAGPLPEITPQVVAPWRPLPMPAATGNAGPLPEIAPQLVAPWRLETGLTREDFEVLSDSIPAGVSSCVPVTGPVSIVLVVDVSASVPAEARSAWLRDSIDGPFVRAVRRGDRVAIGRVGGTGLLFSPGFSGDAAGFVSAAGDVLKRTEKDADRPFGLDGSPIWDAVDRAIDMLESVPGHRTVILLSDGRATSNIRAFADVAARAVMLGIGVGVVSSAWDVTIRQTGTVAARVRPRVFLEQLAFDTGGAYIEAFGPLPNPWLRNEDALNRWLECTLARIVEEMRGGYALTFSAPVDDGQAHVLGVRVKREGLRVRAPLGYRAAGPPR